MSTTLRGQPTSRPPIWKVVCAPDTKHEPLTKQQRHEIVLSALSAKQSIDGPGAREAMRRLDIGQDPQAVLKWDIRVHGARNVDMSAPIHSNAILQAAKANNHAFFRSLGKLLLDRRKPITFPYLKYLLIDGWGDTDRDTVEFTALLPREGYAEVKTLGFCFFTDTALYELAHALLGSGVSLDSIKKTRLRLHLKRPPCLVIQSVYPVGTHTLICSDKRR